MDIEQKLALSARTDRITLIADGLFLYAYNQSAYAVNGLLGLPFKLSVRDFKQLNGEKVIYCGFPKNRIHHYFNNAKSTYFGYEIMDDFNDIYYSAWLKQQTASAKRCGKKARAL